MSAAKRRPNKRQPSGSPTQHRGRITVSGQGPRSSPTAGPAPAASRRYTPRRPVFRIRPTWHKVIGASLIAFGGGVAVANDLAWFGPEPLPGGHSELYLILAVAIAAYGTWWLGLFDRPA